MKEERINGVGRREPDTYLEPLEDEPGEEDLMHWTFNGTCDATDGCTVEPDGQCEHGHVSWLLYLGLI